MNILDQVSVEEILQRLGIVFDDRGNKLMACCPYHSEKTPSFSIYKESGYYKCFGCGESGSIYDLVYNLSNQSIYKFLNIDSPKSFVMKPFVVKEKKEKTLKENNWIIEGDLLDIDSSRFIQEYCWSIGMNDDFINTFNVKYSKSIKIYNDKADPSSIKTFYNRIVIPCLFNNKIYNFECRDFTKKSKVKVLYPSNSEPDILFNFDNINKNETVFVVEGIKGLTKIWTTYSKNVVSTFGKALKDNQKKLLSTLPHVCVVPDNDENKIDRKTNLPVDNVETTIEVYDEFYPFEYEIAYIPYKGKDPNNLSRSQLKRVLDNRQFAKDIILERHWPKEESMSLESLLLACN